MTPLLVTAAVLAAVLTPTPPPPDPGVVSVVRVVDGDTIVTIPGGTTRIRGLDTPETVKPRTPVQCGGPEATAYARQTLLGRRVRLVVNPADPTDRYGRRVAEVWLGDRSYAESAVRAGMGRAYRVSARRQASDWARIVEAEGEARAARRGLWGHCPVGAR